ncbi:MAG TPA: hypothetical protein VFR97_14820 [Capillimicrobium sp.]|nr:hypothetical protein [Capillimicrobium sp.]
MAATVPVEGQIVEAETLWYDLTRWPAFVDGFSHVAKVEGDWPREGRLLWDSHPGGRGRVVEEVTWFSPREGQDVAVEDPKLTGTQRIRFAPGSVTLELVYDLKEGTWLLDVLFVRRALRDSVRRTLQRFAIELRAERELTRESIP